MKKLIWLLLPLLLLPLCALGDTARDITGECRFVVPNNKGNVPYLRDRNEMTAASAEAYRYPHITINVGETPVAAVYVEFGRNPMPFDVLKKVGGEWVVIARSDEGEYAQHYAEFEPQTEPFRIRFDTGNMARTLVVREIYVFSEGERDEEIVHTWDAPVEKADILFIATHPDDEILWFGGAIPTYAGARGCAVQVLYATCCYDYRRLELLNGLWHCGVRNYPEIGPFEDFSEEHVDAVFAVWGKKAIETYLVQQIRRFRPEVVVTQDANGEYGHSQHKAVSASVQRAVELAADPAYDPGSAAQYGAWEVKKLYLHLGDAPTLVMDWEQPLDFFGGKTALTVAREAFTYHKSQNQEKFSVPGPGEACDSTLYTLARSTVGEDSAGGDFLENIPAECLR